jgi:hypothetical protein
VLVECAPSILRAAERRFHTPPEQPYCGVLRVGLVCCGVLQQGWGQRWHTWCGARRSAARCTHSRPSARACGRMRRRGRAPPQPTPCSMQRAPCSMQRAPCTAANDWLGSADHQAAISARGHLPTAPSRHAAAVQCSAAQRSAVTVGVQCSAVQCSAAQCSHPPAQLRLNQSACADSTLQCSAPKRKRPRLYARPCLSDCVHDKPSDRELERRCEVIRRLGFEQA